VGKNYMMIGISFQEIIFNKTQCHNIKAFGTLIKTLTETREPESILKF